jgi:hypothetical protein
MIGFVITTVESVGDITASAEASRVEDDGNLDSRIQVSLFLSFSLSTLALAYSSSLICLHADFVSTLHLIYHIYVFQGGILTDGIASLLSALMTVLPNTTFSQNNGVISLTRCANKRAGYWYKSKHTHHIPLISLCLYVCVSLLFLSLYVCVYTCLEVLTRNAVRCSCLS